MGQRVYTNLDNFAAALVRFGAASQRTQERALRQSIARVDAALDNAARQVGGGDQVISGVGKSGARVSHTTVRAEQSPDFKRVFFRKKGPWQIRDSSISGGDTKRRVASPNLRRSPRPMPPARKFMPSLRTRDGQFFSNFNRSPDGPFVKVNLGSGPRRPYWRNAVQSVQPRVVELHQRAFNDAGYETFG
jgi:hypothetical protein